MDEHIYNLKVAISFHTEKDADSEDPSENDEIYPKPTNTAKEQKRVRRNPPPPPTRKRGLEKRGYTVKAMREMPRPCVEDIKQA
jgi:hypothetical protein